MEFVLTPHVKDILCGRGMCDCKEITMGEDCRLLCAATNCLFHPKESPDPNYGRDIEVKGYAICPRCGVKTGWQEGKEWSDSSKRNILRCKACKKIIPKKLIVWTQKVISKHRRKRHNYFHMECWNAMFVDVPNGDEST